MVIMLYIRTNLDDHRLMKHSEKYNYLVNNIHLTKIQKEKSHPTIHCI